MRMLCGDLAELVRDLPHAGERFPNLAGLGVPQEGEGEAEVEEALAERRVALLEGPCMCCHAIHLDFQVLDVCGELLESEILRGGIGVHPGSGAELGAEHLGVLHRLLHPSHEALLPVALRRRVVLPVGQVRLLQRQKLDEVRRCTKLQVQSDALQEAFQVSSSGLHELLLKPIEQTLLRQGRDDGARELFAELFVQHFEVVKSSQIPRDRQRCDTERQCAKGGSPCDVRQDSAENSGGLRRRAYLRITLKDVPPMSGRLLCVLTLYVV
mmetsp:Transcript_4372/g.17184  ORF Transcript_4372/g.17184 Transcript_4372/m.17184 type:complete len:269 (-) Transcript_4372:148-954(-)